LRVVVQIPCYNEVETIRAVIAEVPRTIDAVDEILIVVIDDGSRDRTGEAAVAAGADYVVRHARNRGLAAAFRTGLDVALRLGADIVVNTDGDNQYRGSDIPKLIAPILDGRAEIVVGDRDASSAPHFSLVKRRLQGFGSQVVRSLSGIEVPDAPSGFRALSREAVLRLNVVTSYSYTLKTLIQAGAQRLAVVSVPISARATARKSRLSRGTLEYVERSIVTIVRAYAMYQPLRVFVTISGILFTAGIIGCGRFLWFLIEGSGVGHIQSLVLSGVLLVIGFQVGLIGLVSDLIAGNRRLHEETLYRLRRLETGANVPGTIEIEESQVGRAFNGAPRGVDHV
jgi:glycosyltransferase involved in cell wall biosynthesis